MLRKHHSSTAALVAENTTQSKTMDEDHLLHQELEALAGNAYNPDTNDQQTSEPISTTIKR